MIKKEGIYNGKKLTDKEKERIRRVRLQKVESLEAPADATPEQLDKFVRQHLKAAWEDPDLLMDGWRETKEKIDGVRILGKVVPGDANFPRYPVSPTFYVG